MPGKNDWNAGDDVTESAMNRPFWIASGVVSGADLSLTISPGRIRYPYQTAVAASGGAQLLTIANAPAATYLTIFQRPSATGNTFIISGTTSAAVPLPPRYDAEPIGRVYTGASLATANLEGPWNAGAFAQYEQRGELTAQARSRAIYYQADGGTSAISSLAFPLASPGTAVASVAFTEALRAAASTQKKYRAMYHATVSYVCSGALTTGNLFVTPVFALKDDTSALLLLHSEQTHRFEVAQDPDSTFGATRGNNQHFTQVLVAINDNNNPQDNTGATLVGYSGDATDASSIRMLAVSLIAIPNYYGEATPGV